MESNEKNFAVLSGTPDGETGYETEGTSDKSAEAPAETVGNNGEGSLTAEHRGETALETEAVPENAGGAAAAQPAAPAAKPNGAAAPRAPLPVRRPADAERDPVTGLFDSISADVREFFRKIGITASETKIRDLDMRLSRIRNYVPKIGFFGKTGAGKSSLCNVLFGADTCKVGHAGSVTRSIQELAITVNGKKIVLVDVPGVGEDRRRDKEYYDLYRRLLPSLDIIIWVQKADDRAFTDVQNAYLRVFKPYFDAHPDRHIPFVIALNQVDKVEPAVIERDGQLTIAWNARENRPSGEQQSNIEDIIVNIGEKIPVGDNYIVPVSASRKYNLYRLIRAMLRELPAEKISVGDAFNPDLNLSKPKNPGKTGTVDFWELMRSRKEKAGAAQASDVSAAASGDGTSQDGRPGTKSAASDGPANEIFDEDVLAADEDDLGEDDETDFDDEDDFDDEEDDFDDDDGDEDEDLDDDAEAEETREMLRRKRLEAVKGVILNVFGAVAEGGRAVIRGIKKFAGWVASKLFG